MLSKLHYAKTSQREQSIAPFIPQSSHITPDVIITKDGDLQRTWRVGGISFETVDPEDTHIRKEQLNTLIRSIGSSKVAIWQHTCHMKTTVRLDSEFDEPISGDYGNRYNDSLADHQMMKTDMYLTLVYRPVESMGAKLVLRAGRRTPEEINAQRKKSIHTLDEISQRIESALQAYGLDRLTTYIDKQTGNDGQQHDVLCSQPLSFLNYLVCGVWQKVRVPQAPIDQYLGTAWLDVGIETIEIRTPSRIRFAQGLDLKDYNENSEPGILNGLLYEQYEFVLTQSFSLFNRRDGEKELKRQKRYLESTEDASSDQVIEIGHAINDLIAGKFVMGEYHMGLMVFGDTVAEASEHASSAATTLENAGFLPALVTTATEAAWYARLPCNWRFRPRLAILTSRNFAGLSCLHSFPTGKKTGNPWGSAVTMFKTPSSQSFYFNFHHANSEQDKTGATLLGNTRLIGQSGGGKTITVNHLWRMSQQYAVNARFTTIYFDVKQGARMCILASGGKYLPIKNGKPTGFNPFQVVHNEPNAQFLETLVKTLASDDGSKVTATDELRISKAVRTVLDMPWPMRSLSMFLQNITEGTSIDERENSLSKRLAKWCRDDGNGRTGSLAWVLDCETDLIDFNTHHNYGFDGTDFLDNEQVRTPIAMYLLHRMKDVIDGRRFIYFFEEAWKWIDNPVFSQFAGQEQMTIRSKNGLGVFATQMPKSVLNSAISAELVEQMATEIYLPNPRANKSDYVDGFGVTEAEFELIKELSLESHLFLVKQDNHSVLAWLDLEGFDDDLAIMSGTSEHIEVFEDVIASVGDNPADWIPEFHRRRKLTTGLLTRQTGQEVAA